MVAHVILVSPPVPIGLGFFISLGLGLGLGLGGQGLGLGLDNFTPTLAAALCLSSPTISNVLSSY